MTGRRGRAACQHTCGWFRSVYFPAAKGIRRNSERGRKKADEPSTAPSAGPPLLTSFEHWPLSFPPVRRFGVTFAPDQMLTSLPLCLGQKEAHGGRPPASE